MPLNTPHPSPQYAAETTITGACFINFFHTTMLLLVVWKKINETSACDNNVLLCHVHK